MVYFFTASWLLLFVFLYLMCISADNVSLGLASFQSVSTFLLECLVPLHLM